jgi:lysophospholipase
MELFGSESNPVPEGAVAGMITTSDGVKLRFARWRPAARRSRGTICLFQGRAEAIEKYFEVVGDLRRRGYAVATFDWRGQGGSERRLRNRRKGHIDSFTEYDRDLDAFMEQVALPDCPPPHFALAHSTGGLIALRAARDGRTRFNRTVVTSALLELGPTRPSQPVAYRLSGLLAGIGLGELNVPGAYVTQIERMPFEGNFLTSDAARFQRSVEIALKAPQVAIGAPTIGWLYAACQAMHEASEADFAPAIKTPVLLASGSLDRVVSPRAIEGLAGELRSGALVDIAGARHEIMMERESLREQFWAAFDAFVPGAAF